MKKKKIVRLFVVATLTVFCVVGSMKVSKSFYFMEYCLVERGDWGCTLGLTCVPLPYDNMIGRCLPY
jgi:hypothetical protein